MTNPIQQNPLSEAEFDRLDEILEAMGADRGMTVEGVDGLFAALVCSPIPVQPSEWMPIVWGGDPPQWNTMEEAKEAIGLLMRMWNQVAGSIHDGSFTPLLTSGTDEEGIERALPHPWCMGFVEGMRVHKEHWFDASNEELQELMLPIGLIAMDAAVMLGEAPESLERLPQEKLEEFADLIPDLVIALRLYWMEHPIPSAAPAGAASVGADDACPCGSGQKFKDCHGSSVH